MSLNTSTSTTSPLVRVAVLAAPDGPDGGGRLTDLALPAGLPLREIVPAVRRIVAPVGADSTDLTTQLSLARVGGAPFSLDTTLDTVGVVDGDLLALQPVPVGPAAPGVVEDIADAAVIFSTAREKPWGNGNIRTYAGWALVGLVLAATAVATVARLHVGGPVGLFTVFGVALLTVAAALGTKATDRRLSTALSLAALVPIGAAFTLALPGQLGAPQLLLGSAGVAAWSIVGITLGERAIAAFTATTVMGLAGVITGAVTAVWSLDATVIGSILMIFALLVVVQAAHLSTLWARFPVPNLPAPGDPTPSALPSWVLADLPRRVRVSESHQTGFVAGSVVVMTAASLLLVAGHHVSPWAWYLLGASALATALRARVWDSAACKGWLLGQPYLLTVALVVAFLVSDRQSAAWWALIGLAALVLVWVVAALQDSVASPESYSLPMRRAVGMLASALDASLLPVIAYLVGLFTWVIER